jgi:hypothetical protein
MSKIISLQERRQRNKLNPDQRQIRNLSDRVEDLERELEETTQLLVRVLRLLKKIDIARTFSNEKDKQ